ncbi:hypothetical protein [Rhizohabitans arisaemae]|uniref:hypothetical protein n=1 Tax=Rhizohabitans arisaemae TaxID=2720610 RepID=UPI0024B1F6C6|nr:hypothetical protein [Rhizohabitans arisaemae]
MSRDEQSLGSAMARVLIELPEHLARAVQADLEELVGKLTTTGLRVEDPTVKEVCRQARQALETVIDNADLARRRRSQPPPPPPEPAVETAALPEPVPAPDPVPEPPDLRDLITTSLGRLWEAMTADETTRHFTAAYPGTHTGDPARLWERIHVLCLRLSADTAQTWRRHAFAAVSAAAEEYVRRGGTAAPPPEFRADGDPLPGLASVGYPGGFLSDGVPLPGELAEYAKTLEPRGQADLLRMAAHSLWLARHDSGVRQGLEAVCATALGRSDDPGNFQLYLGALKRAFDGLAATRPGSKDELVALHQVDETLRALVPLPLREPGSWWDERTRTLNERLGKTGGTAYFIPAERVDWSSQDTKGDDPKVTRREAGPAARPYGGKVIWILRVAYPAKSIKARVVYVDGES